MNSTFLNNKYTKLYYQILEKCSTRSIIADYRETHHIIPKCAGGPDSPDNLIKFSSREHFICHWLLTKMTSGNLRLKLLHAFQLMNHKNSRGITRYSNSRAYEYNKRLRAKMLSDSMKGAVRTPEVRKAISKAKQGTPAWNKGMTWEDILGEEAGKAYKERNAAHLLQFRGWKWSVEQKKELSVQRQGSKNPSALSCEIDGVYYETVKAAAVALGMDKTTVLWRLNATSERFKDWKRLTKGKAKNDNN